MSDVFISYAREDREAAQALAHALEARGLSVWWDRVIPPGRQFDEVIEEQLDDSRCAVVLWTAASAASKWVRAEAGEALQQDKLVPALLTEGLKLPLEFRRVQAADLSGWQAGQPSPALDEFCASVAAAVERAASSPRTQSRARKAARAAPAAPPVAAPVAAPVKRKAWPWVLAAVVGVGAVASWLETPDGSLLPTPAPPKGIDQNLAWRDYLFSYQGRVTWDGQQSVATVDLQAQDSGNGVIAAQGRVTALVVPNTAPMLVLYLKVPVPNGDSRTVGPHLHENHLIFRPDVNVGWVFMRNCQVLSPPQNCFP